MFKGYMAHQEQISSVNIILKVTNMDFEKEARSIFENLTKDQFIQLLHESGFDVREGSGRVVYTEEFEVVAEKHFFISVKYSLKKSSNIMGDTEANTFVLPAAC